MKTFLTCVLICFLLPGVFAQIDSADLSQDPTCRTGWTFGGLPIVAFDSDMGFQYGVLVNLFSYGDGSTYPEYRHTILLEVSRFTKGGGVNQLFYDSKHLIPGNIRITADVSYLTEKALNFYGFNGYDAVYYRPFEEDGSDEYISRMFYRQQRRILRMLADFQGNLIGNRLRWLTGFTYMNFEMNTVDIDKINKGKSEEDKLPDVPLLYDRYNEWEIIPEDESKGGSGKFLKFGIVFDSRDFEASPNKGIWSEVVFMTAPRFLFNDDFAYTKVSLIHRQYIPILYNKVIAAYRLGYQTTIDGHTPYYLQPVMINSFSTTTKFDGLGGARTLRGIHRNRIVGDGIAYCNFEIRWKMLEGIVWKQNVYLGLTGFIDAGMVTRDINYRAYLPVNIEFDHYFDPWAESLHIGYGAGLRIGINENFIIAVDFGIAADKRDGSSGLYVGINNLF